MIHGVTEDMELFHVLQSMHESSHDFHLTGSRFFTPQKVTCASDWDFFVEDTEKARNFLLAKGFRNIAGNYGHLVSRNYPEDITMVQRWSGNRVGNNIDVILTKDIVGRLAVQRAMKGLGKASKDAKAWKKLFGILEAARIANKEIEP